MDFIDDVDFIFAFSRRNNGLFAKVADIIDASVGGGIDFDDIEIIIFELIFKTVDFVRQNASHGRFASAARADKKVGMRDLIIRDGFLEHRSNLLLPDHFGEGLGAISTVERLH